MLSSVGIQSCFSFGLIYSKLRDNGSGIEKTGKLLSFYSHLWIKGPWIPYLLNFSFD